jgi:uncharacterized protein YbaR (Trm112 family)
VKYRLLDLLACPICKTFPLPYYVFQENDYPSRKLSESVPYCREYCGLNVEYVAKLAKEKLICPECIKKEVSEGLLKCPNCGRWYPIIDEIPHMLPDDLREEKEDTDFLRKWKAKIPMEVLREGKPFSLGAEAKL